MSIQERWVGPVEMAYLLLEYPLDCCAHDCASCRKQIEEVRALLKKAFESQDAAIARYSKLPPDDNLSVAFVLEDLRAVRRGDYDPHLR